MPPRTAVNLNPLSQRNEALELRQLVLACHSNWFMLLLTFENALSVMVYVK